jgi:hypothetical protein
MGKPKQTDAERKEYFRNYRARNLEKIQAYEQAHYLANRTRYRQLSKVWRTENKEHVEAKRAEYKRTHRAEISAYMKRRYEANREHILMLDRARRGLPKPTRPRPDTCECCGAPPGKQALALDHCHTTGAFRGWLCSSCNTALGKLGDNKAGLLRALAYLERAEDGG